MHIKGKIYNLNCVWILPQCLFLLMLEICCDFLEWWVATDTVGVTTPVWFIILVHGQNILPLLWAMASHWNFHKTHEEIYFSEVKISEEVCLIFLRVIFN